MTTIIWDGKYLVTDSQLQGHWIENHVHHKVWVGETCLVAFPGAWMDACSWKEALADQGAALDAVFAALREKAPGKESDSECFVYCKTRGRAYCVQPNGVPYEIKAPWAMGSGGGYALAACMAGATAQRACEIACELDPNSGGDIRGYQT